MKLDSYNKKRDFEKTSEPAGAAASSTSGRLYVIQKHAASHLHYDFRLELDGVLLSWAVPKGPSLDTSVKRLAMQTEDHPVEYGSFEGTIPKGEYGGGGVMLWDRGTWTAESDPRAAYGRGRLTFELDGQKLRGRWHLVRTPARDQGNKRAWLLFKGRDDEARKDSDILVEQPNSVISGKSIDEIGGTRDGAVWRSNRRGREPLAAESRARTSASRKGKKADLPKSVSPALATLVSEPPEGDGWAHEVKLDGYRILARIEDGKVTLLSRNAKDWTERFGTIARALAAQGPADAILDGEVVVLRSDGVSDFQLLQSSMRDLRDHELTYFVFDLLADASGDLRETPLLARKEKLKALLASVKTSKVRYNDHIVGSGKTFFEHACAFGLEGIVSKRIDAAYCEGRSRNWLKVKSSRRQEFVVVGYTQPKGGRSGFGALLLGTREEGGELRYAGKVGTGFSDQSMADLCAKLRLLEQKTPTVKERIARGRDMLWVKPQLVAEVSFTEMTRDGRLRHPSFKGLRTDKPASSVVVERPAPGAMPHVRVTNPERILFARDRISKQEIADYYASVPQWILPHVANRPLSLVRCPSGIEKSCFFQKHPMPHTSADIHRARVKEGDGASVEAMYIDDLAGLLSLSQLGTLEVHTWGSRVADVERPDVLVFDLDPDPVLPWAVIAEAARAVRDSLRQFDLQSFVKTTGGKGLHVCAPIVPEATWELAKLFSRAVADSLVRSNPARYVATMTKARRVGKVFIDFFRNGRGATFIAPYSTRAREHATIAMPIEWDELERDASKEPFTVRNVQAWLGKRKKDPWAPMLKLKQRLPSVVTSTASTRGK